MTTDEAAAILRQMRREAMPVREMAIQAILFGIRYHAELRDLSLREISRRVGVGQHTCSVEIRHGMQLGKYVELRQG